MYSVFGALAPNVPEYTEAVLQVGDSLGIPEKTANVKDALKEDLESADINRKGLAALALGSAAWEWGPFNELVAAVPSLATLESTGSPIAAGIVGGAIYAAQQGVFGLATAGAITAIPKTEKSIREEFNTTSESGATTTDRALLLVGMGTSAVVLNEHVRDESRTFKQDAKLVGKLTLALTAIDVAVFTAANGLIDNSDKINVDSGTLVDIATNPWTYIGIFGLTKFIGAYKKYHTNAKTN